MRDTVQRLLKAAGTTYAEQAGIRLADRPAPLYRLLVLSVLLSTRIKADIAVAAARELFRAGCGTPRGMLRATFATALVRVALDAKLAREITG